MWPTKLSKEIGLILQFLVILVLLLANKLVEIIIVNDQDCAIPLLNNFSFFLFLSNLDEKLFSFHLLINGN